MPYVEPSPVTFSLPIFEVPTSSPAPVSNLKSFWSLALFSSSLSLLICLIFNHCIPHAVGTDTQITTNRKILTCETAIAHASRRPCSTLPDVVNDVRFSGPAITTWSADTLGAKTGTSECKVVIRMALPIGTPRELQQVSMSKRLIKINRRTAYPPS